jgi:glycosyltransferase involved in cell wall biosynthesis
VKILIAAASFASNLSGIQRHAFNVARCVLPQPEISALHLFLAPWQQDLVQAAGLPENDRLTIHFAGMDKSALSRNLWYYRELPKLAGKLGVDLVHLSYPMPLNGAAFSCPTVVSLHDLYPYQIPTNFGFPKFIFNRMVLQQCLRNANAIACVSEATQSSLRDYVPNSVLRKAIRTYNCVEAEPLTVSTSPIPGWNQEPFLLCTAQHRRNKNISLLIQAYDRLLRSGQIDALAKLVIVGIGGPETRNINRLIGASGLGQRIHLLEGLSEQELQWCYQNCEVLVAPSIVEGFGLPIAEGLLAGCRIVCSDIPAHREVGGAYCRFVKLEQDAVEAVAAAIAAAVSEPKNPPIPLPQLSGPVLAKQYVALYRRIIATEIPARRNNELAPVEILATERSSVSVADRHPELQFRGK